MFHRHKQNPDSVNDNPSHSSTAYGSWPLRETLAIMLLGSFILPFLFALPFHLLFPHWPKTWFFVVDNLAFVMAWGFLFIGLGYRYRGAFFKEIGLLPTRPLNVYLSAGILCAGAMVVMSIGLGYLAHQFGWPTPDPFIVFPGQDLRILSLFAVLFAPVVEETVFRGYLQSSLTHHLRTGWAIVLTALVFTLFHAHYYEYFVAVVYVFALGLLLGITRWKMQSVLPCMMAHCLNNMMAFFVWLPNG